MNTWRIFKLDKKIYGFLFWVSFGLGFSMSIILSTIGLMEGFERGLLSALNKSNGDFTINSSLSREDLSDLTERIREKYPTLTSAGYLKTEAFLVSPDRQSKGVIILAGDFNKNALPIAHLKPGIKLLKSEALIGEDLARELNLQVGDSFRSLIAKGGGTSEFLIKNFKIKGLFKTNLYEKDSRLALVNINEFFDQSNYRFNYSVYNFNYPLSHFPSKKRD